MIEEDLKRIADSLEKLVNHFCPESQTEFQINIEDIVANNNYAGFGVETPAAPAVEEPAAPEVEEAPVKLEPKKRKSKKAESAPAPETPVEIEEVNATTATEAPAADTPTILEEPKHMTYAEARAELLAFCKDREKGNKILREVLDAHHREGFLDYSDAKPGEFAEIVNEFKAKYTEVSNA